MNNKKIINANTTPMFEWLMTTMDYAQSQGDLHIVRSCELLEDEIHWLEHQYTLPPYHP
jgi:hypothetical protein